LNVTALIAFASTMIRALASERPSDATIVALAPSAAASA
jgi:hypothetical protein